MATAIGLVNAAGSVDDAPAELLEGMSQALEYARMSEGAFDPTVAPLLRLYASRAARGEGLPDPLAVKNALGVVGHEGVHIDGVGIELGRPGMSVTLDGIAKGYVVDRTLATLAAARDRRMSLGPSPCRIPGTRAAPSISFVSRAAA